MDFQQPHHKTVYLKTELRKHAWEEMVQCQGVQEESPLNQTESS
jgi:hypothetical protein